MENHVILPELVEEPRFETILEDDGFGFGSNKCLRMVWPRQI